MANLYTQTSNISKQKKKRSKCQVTSAYDHIGKIVWCMLFIKAIQRSEIYLLAEKEAIREYTFSSNKICPQLITAIF